MNAKNNKSKQTPKKSFETIYDSIQQCTVLKIIDVEGLSPFFLLQHPRFGVYRINTGRNGLQMSR